LRITRISPELRELRQIVSLKNPRRLRGFCRLPGAANVAACGRWSSVIRYGPDAHGETRKLLTNGAEKAKPVSVRMNVPISIIAGALANRGGELQVIWSKATPEGKGIIFVLAIFSIFAWSVMASKAMQMRRAKKMNRYFNAEFRSQKSVLAIHDRKVQVDGCPLFNIYQEGCQELDNRLKLANGDGRKKHISLKGTEHVKRTLERSVAQESLKLESGLILLAIAVSGAPFLGLLGTVWGVMSAFSYVALAGTATLEALAPGVSAALVTTVAGLLVAIPSMFGYNWLVHNLRVMTVELDNFAQELVSKMETEFLRDDEDEWAGKTD
jgi:biopolymer transport protein TolQ